MKKEKGQQDKGFSRRRFLKKSFAFGAGVIGAGALGINTVFGVSSRGKFKRDPDSEIDGVQIGTITYSYRSMEDQSAEALLEYVVNSGISAIELMGGPAERYAGKPANPVNRRKAWMLYKKKEKGTLTSDEKKQFQAIKKQAKAYGKKAAKWRESASMDKFVELGKMYKDAGVDIYAWKPSVFGKENTDEEINYGFRAAKALGAPACTTEHPGDDEQTKRLGDIAAKHQIYMSYHAHTQATPTLWDTALKQSDWNAINLDIGHWVAAGNPSVIPFIEAHHERIESLHIKDRTTPEHGQLNLPWGEGDTPIGPVLQLIRTHDYDFPATIELEYQIPEESNAVKEVAKCLEYCRDLLER